MATVTRLILSQLPFGTSIAYRLPNGNHLDLARALQLPGGNGRRWPVFGKELRSLRVAAGMDLKTLARRSGVSASYLSRLEAGKRGIPTLHVLLRVADALNTPPMALLYHAGIRLDTAREADPFGLPAGVRRLLERAVGTFSTEDWAAVEAFLAERLASSRSDTLHPD
jgi:transcriptional regulator with XRE-family HTH domain